MFRNCKKLKNTINNSSLLARTNTTCYSPCLDNSAIAHKSVFLYCNFCSARSRLMLALVLVTSLLLQPFVSFASTDYLTDENTLDVTVVENFYEAVAVVDQSLVNPVADAELVAIESDTQSVNVLPEVVSTVESEVVQSPESLDVESQVDMIEELSTMATSSIAALEPMGTTSTEFLNAPAGSIENTQSDSALLDIEVISTTTTVAESVDLSDRNELSYKDTSISSSTVLGPERDETLVSFVESDTHLSFSQNECTMIEDGSFYCQKASPISQLSDGLFAAPDVDGDLEIFLVRNGSRTQITNNLVDDASPYYDSFSNTIVWHRLIDDRYQIVSYDVVEATETVITDTDVNNMEPTRHGKYLVWQRWIDNNWEIILYDGVTEQRLTQSAEHDIAPHIRGSLVIWNTRTPDGIHKLQTYDIAQRTYTEISDTTGISVSNPRMIVMYDEVHQNGDVVTKGYDLISGEIVPLTALPKEIPDEIPSSDSTGETRALITSVTAPKPSDDEIENDTDSPVAIDPPVDPFTLDIQATSTATLSEAVSTSSLAIPDLLVPNSIPHTLLSTVSDIPDLVISANTPSSSVAVQ